MREIRNGCTQKSFSRERKKWGCECDLALRTVSSETYVIGWKWEVHFSLLPDYMLSSLSNVRFFLLHLPLFTRYTLPTLLFSFLFFSFPFFSFPLHQILKFGKWFSSLHHTLLGYLSIIAYHFHRYPVPTYQY